MTKSSPSAKQPPNGSVVLIDSDYSGRDEMNLAGNPFALLQPASRSKAESNHIKYERLRRLPNGKEVMASWEVTGHPELGPPGPSDELLYLVLLEITREVADRDGIPWPQTVHFSRYNLLDRLGWYRNSASYKLLRDCMARLQTVSIQADYSWWDASAKQFLPSIGFGIIDEYVLAEEPKGRKSADAALPLSSFKWSARLQESFMAGNVRNLALDFVISLSAPTSRRLFRFLDMHRRATTPPRREFGIGLFKLRDHLAMDVKYASKIKERLKPAVDELIARGYLRSFRYSTMKSGEFMVTYTFETAVQNPSAAPNPFPEVGLPQSPAMLLAIQTPTPPLSLPAPETPFKDRPFETRTTGILVRPQACADAFDTLSEAEQVQLREQAQKHVPVLRWNLLDNPDQPTSLWLWDLVQYHHPDAVIAAEKALDNSLGEPQTAQSRLDID